MPLGQITLPVTFGTPTNYWTEFIQFKVADFETSYHTILGRPALAKFMAIPHYPYSLLEMPPVVPLYLYVRHILFRLCKIVGMFL
jgi:hypothetical protein